MRKAIVPKVFGLVVLLGTSGAVYSQQAPASDTTSQPSPPPQPPPVSIYALPNTASQIPPNAGQPAPYPTDASIQPYNPPPPQPNTPFNWDAACGSLSTLGGGVAIVAPPLAPEGTALAAVGAGCKAAVAAATGGADAAAGQAGKELINAGVGAATTQLTHSEVAGEVVSVGAEKVEDAGQALAAAPGDASFNCAKVGQCPGLDGGGAAAAGSTPPAPQPSSQPQVATQSLNQSVSSLEDDLGVSAPATVAQNYGNGLNAAAATNTGANNAPQPNQNAGYQGNAASPSFPSLAPGLTAGQKAAAEGQKAPTQYRLCAAHLAKDQPWFTGYLVGGKCVPDKPQ